METIKSIRIVILKTRSIKHDKITKGQTAVY